MDKLGMMVRSLTNLPGHSWRLSESVIVKMLWDSVVQYVAWLIISLIKHEPLPLWSIPSSLDLQVRQKHFSRGIIFQLLPRAENQDILAGRSSGRKLRLGKAWAEGERDRCPVPLGSAPLPTGWTRLWDEQGALLWSQPDTIFTEPCDLSRSRLVTYESHWPAAFIIPQTCSSEHSLAHVPLCAAPAKLSPPKEGLGYVAMGVDQVNQRCCMIPCRPRPPFPHLWNGPGPWVIDSQVSHRGCNG